MHNENITLNDCFHYLQKPFILYSKSSLSFTTFTYCNINSVLIFNDFSSFLPSSILLI